MLLFALACNDPADDEKPDEQAVDSGDGQTDDSAEPEDSGADTSVNDTGDPSGIDVRAWISPEVHTVVVVEWTTAEPTSGHVEFGLDANYGESTPVSALSTEHRAFLLGMTADTEVHFRVVGDGADSDLASEDFNILTQSLPAGIPQYVTSGSVDGRWKYTVLPTQGSASYVNIVNENGEIVWYYMPEGGGNLMKAILTHDRQHVLLGHAGDQGALEDSKLTWISLDGSSVVVEAAPYFDHDLTELPDGTITMIVVDEHTMDDGHVWAADKLVERAPDGTWTDVFNSWDSLDPTGLGLEDRYNWTHANGIEYVASEDCYYLSLKEIGSLLKIERSSGTIDWMVNGMYNQFEFLDGAIPGAMQHQFEVLGPGHLLLFDNGAPDRGYSRVVELQLDTTAMTAGELWQYVRVPPVYVYAKGDVQRFEDGTTQVTWSTSGEMQIVDTDGVVQWQLNSDLGEAMTFVQPVQSFYEDR
jgi:hypothetical protein